MKYYIIVKQKNAKMYNSKVKLFNKLECFVVLALVEQQMFNLSFYIY